MSEQGELCVCISMLLVLYNVMGLGGVWYRLSFVNLADEAKVLAKDLILAISFGLISLDCTYFGLHPFPLFCCP